jgi:hypothetical protein
VPRLPRAFQGTEQTVRAADDDHEQHAVRINARQANRFRVRGAATAGGISSSPTTGPTPPVLPTTVNRMISITILMLAKVRGSTC